MTTEVQTLANCTMGVTADGDTRHCEHRTFDYGADPGTITIYRHASKTIPYCSLVYLCTHSRGHRPELTRQVDETQLRNMVAKFERP